MPAAARPREAHSWLREKARPEPNGRAGVAKDQRHKGIEMMVIEAKLRQAVG